MHGQDRNGEKSENIRCVRNTRQVETSETIHSWLSFVSFGHLHPSQLFAFFLTLFSFFPPSRCSSHLAPNE